MVDRDELILGNLGLVRKQAWRRRGMWYHEDLVSAGVVGLIESVDRFRPGRGKLSTFAGRAIFEAMRQCDNSYAAVPLPDYLHALVVASGRKPVKVRPDQVSALDAARESGRLKAEDRLDEMPDRRRGDDPGGAVPEMLSVLDDWSRSVVELRLGLGGLKLTPDEIASHLGSTRGKVNAGFDRAIKKLRDHFAESSDVA